MLNEKKVQLREDKFNACIITYVWRLPFHLWFSIYDCSSYLYNSQV